ncbi:hypothetical protein [Streptomyces sp. NPDC005283]|uniref:hypothetical protein n=1 Tax=Streptomyces sp. NPDC005283 TaxID=3156871 RepID=UPI003455A233
MHQLTLLKLTLVVILVPYGGLGALWVMRRVRDRRAVARLAAFDLDPYYAYAVATGHTAERPAAAALLLKGLIVLNANGVVRLTAAGRDLERTPSHPVAAACWRPYDSTTPRPRSAISTEKPYRSRRATASTAPTRTDSRAGCGGSTGRRCPPASEPCS